MKRFPTAVTIAVMLLAGLAAMERKALSQEPHGTILGTVTDSSGAVIPSAQVQVTNMATSVSTQVVTNSTGSYRAPYLPPGLYSVAVEHAGFKKYVRTGLELQLAGKLELNIALEPCEVSQRHRCCRWLMGAGAQ